MIHVKRIRLTTLAILTIAIVSGCGAGARPLVGKWVSDRGVVLEFKPDGTATRTAATQVDRYQWHLMGTRLDISPMPQGADRFMVGWKQSGSTLTLTTGILPGNDAGYVAREARILGVFRRK